LSSDVTTPAGATPATSTHYSEASRRLLEETFNQGNLALVDELIAPDAVNHDPATPPELRGLRGPEQFKRIVGMYRTAFPDVNMVVDDVISSGDKVVLRWHSEGTHRGELSGLAPTGARVSVTGLSIDHWKDGKVVEAWAEWDNLGLARQIGAAPPEGSVGEKIGAGVQRVMARRLRAKNQS
jgi:predicted ester cyclase